MSTERPQGHDEIFRRLLQILADSEEDGALLFDLFSEVTQDEKWELIKQDRQLAEVVLPESAGDHLHEVWCEVVGGGYRGHKQLQDYVTLQRRSKPSVYLARWELLSAMLGEDQGLVRRVLDSRQRIHAEFPLESRDAYKEASASELQQMVSGYVSPDQVDFRVSGTKPPQ